jgi:hypothetical protein
MTAYSDRPTRIWVTNRCLLHARMFRVWPVRGLYQGRSRQFAWLEPGETRHFRIDRVIAYPMVSTCIDGKWERLYELNPEHASWWGDGGRC